MPSNVDVKDLVEEVRAHLLSELALNSELFDKTDVERALDNQWHVERFLTYNKYNVSEASKMLVGTLKWRHEYAIPTLCDSDFPQEFFRMGIAFVLGTDRQNNHLVYTRLRLYRRVKNLERLVKQFLIYNFEKADRKADGRGMAIIMDCSGAGVSNLDWDMLRFLAVKLTNYCPDGLSYILVYNLPWILVSAWSLFRTWLPEQVCQRIRFANKNEIYEYIDKANLPLCLGGESLVNYHTVPEGCRPALEVFAELGIPQRDAQQILKNFRPQLEEAEKEIRVLE